MCQSEVLMTRGYEDVMCGTHYAQAHSRNLDNGCELHSFDSKEAGCCGKSFVEGVAGDRIDCDRVSDGEGDQLQRGRAILSIGPASATRICPSAPLEDCENNGQPSHPAQKDSRSGEAGSTSEEGLQRPDADMDEPLMRENPDRFTIYPIR